MTQAKETLWQTEIRTRNSGTLLFKASQWFWKDDVLNIFDNEGDVIASFPVAEVLLVKLVPVPPT